MEKYEVLTVEICMFSGKDIIVTSIITPQENELIPIPIETCTDQTA